MCFRVENELTRVANVSVVCNQSYSTHTRKQISEKFQSNLFENFTRNWFDAINSNTGNRFGLGGNKLRTYKLFKELMIRNYMLILTSYKGLTEVPLQDLDVVSHY